MRSLVKASFKYCLLPSVAIMASIDYSPSVGSGNSTPLNSSGYMSIFAYEAVPDVMSLSIILITTYL